MITVDEIKKLYNFSPIPNEGGLFISTYRSKDMIKRNNLDKNMASAILFLETETDFSRMHRLCTDEIYHFYLGDSVEMLLLNEDDTGEVKTLGHDILNGELVQTVVNAFTWQGSRLKFKKYGFALMGTTMAPGFSYEDYEHGIKDELLRMYPGFSELIERFT